jgi:hypothetical protein
VVHCKWDYCCASNDDGIKTIKAMSFVPASKLAQDENADSRKTSQPLSSHEAAIWMD